MPVTLTDKISYKRLVAAGNNEIWYGGTGVSAGTMVELTAANGDIDTTDQLEMFEGYQKVFIANGSNLKVADFVNTKLTHTALTTAHAKGDLLTQATTNAQMIVDHTNTAKTLTYGYVTSGTFNTTNSVTGSGSGTAFTPTAITSNPHWYDWTVHPGGASGTMPNKAYLGCLYRGRCVLSGNPEYPYQWYMSRQANPWDFAYTANDTQAPVAGGNADAGELGDIVRCLIPYKDDYLIFGSSTSIQLLRGDPAESGSIDDLDLTVGIYGANSWCFDGDSNLYFFGTGGIYMLPAGFGPIKNLSQLYLPDIIDDEDADISTHRITMAYDRKRYGILICITKISDGTNSNYWYDLKTQAFFPESYPTACGPYSLFYYDANDKDYRELLVGSKDGYIRQFDEADKDDDSGASDTAISSYATLPIQKLNEKDDSEGKLTSMTFELAGGASGGAFSDTDGLSYELHTADDAETCLEDIRDAATARESGTLSGTGRKNRIRKRVRGAYLGVKLYNSTASETWVVNKIIGEIKPAGKIK